MGILKNIYSLNIAGRFVSLHVNSIHRSISSIVLKILNLVAEIIYFPCLKWEMQMQPNLLWLPTFEVSMQN